MMEDKTCVNCGNFGDSKSQYLCDVCMEHLKYPIIKTEWIQKNKK